MKPKSVTIYIDEETGEPLEAVFEMARESKVKQGESWKCNQLGTACKIELVQAIGQGYRVYFVESNASYVKSLTQSKFLKSYIKVEIN